MGKFVWKDDIVVDFGDGVTFKVSNDMDFVKKNMLEINTKLQRKIDKNPNDDTAAVNALLDAIDEVLGDGATGRIFAGHALSPRNVMAAYLFITDEVLTQISGYDDLLADLAQNTKKFNAMSLPAISDETKRAVFNKAAELGVPMSSVPSVKPRL